ARRHRPRHRFAGRTARDWQTWRKALLPAVLQSLGRLPDPVPLRPAVIAEWAEDGLRKQKVVFDVERGLAATAYVFRPARARGRLPAILACHGHGPLGKDAPMGTKPMTGTATAMNRRSEHFGLEMAKAGFVVMAIDWRGFGERDDRRKPHWHDITMGRDLCNVHYLRANILGMTMLGLNLHDGRCALNYLGRQPFVDPHRLGVMGGSLGGTMTTWIALAEPRVKAADVICYSDRFSDFGMRDANFCGNQITPGLYELCDLPDLQGLIAPRPLLVEIGAYDECFRVEAAMSCYRDVAKIYRAAGVRDRLVLDLFDGGHQWGAHKSVEFFCQHLGVERK
ncbi:prolyl oligopeptidase family serine peptidase, partial [bacterium]|nr:prolyl oligopeptidase family serine peptidase [bacterium]